MKKLIIVFFIALALCTCANQGFPPGGPEDKTPPRVIAAFPPNDSTGVSRTTKVQILFSEPVVPFTVEKALFITPFVGDRIKLKWRGDRQLTIQFSDSLLPNRTYVVTIGAGAKDRRNNMMKESFTLAFSTGEHLDRGQISGRLYGTDLGGAQVWAYDLSLTPDPDPSRHTPLYATQTGEEGLFRLSYMAFGRYRLFAVKDRNLNNRYDPEFDQIGVAHRDVQLDSLNRTDSPLTFRLAQRDTTRPRLEAVSAPDRQHVILRFSEPIRAEAARIDNFMIVTGSDTLAVFDAYFDPQNSALLQLATAPQQSGLFYQLQIKEIKDQSGLTMAAPTLPFTFTGSALPDTVRPRYVAMSPRDSSRAVPVNSSIKVFFSEAMAAEPLTRLFHLADSSGNPVSGDIAFPTGNRLVFTPHRHLAGKMRYTVSLPPDSITDLAGNPLADSLFQKHFITLNPDTLSAIAGTVADADSAARGPFFLKAVLVGDKEPHTYELFVPNAGKFEFRDLMPGRYVIEVFRDEDENREFTFGTPYPFQPAERFFVYPDTIEIRPRWPSDGETILLPR
ncbi:MAG: Ig-like domain-containing protein [candidate division KSB1 bacterium]|nr:Ig-like domain-containing protein [candidate division KSB1 bacterium]